MRKLNHLEVCIFMLTVNRRSVNMDEIHADTINAAKNPYQISI